MAEARARAVVGVIAEDLAELPSSLARVGPKAKRSHHGAAGRNGSAGFRNLSSKIRVLERWSTKANIE